MIDSWTNEMEHTKEAEIEKASVFISAVVICGYYRTLQFDDWGEDNNKKAKCVKIMTTWVSLIFTMVNASLKHWSTHFHSFRHNKSILKKSLMTA